MMARPDNVRTVPRAREISTTDGYDRSYRVKAADGVEFAMHLRAATHRTHRHPVILCHGMSSNRYNLDYSERISFAVFLRQQGFDVWVLELRGAGRSQRPRRPVADSRFSFDRYALFDAPAAIAFAADYSGVEQVHWVGHSMGGMTLYAYLASYGATAIRSGIAAGSPAKTDELLRIPVIRPFMRVLRTGRVVPVFPSHMVGPAIEQSLKIYDAIAPRRANGSTATRRERAQKALRFSNRALSPLPGMVGFQFSQWVKRGTIHTLDGKTDFVRQLLDVSVPLLLVASAHDEIVPVASVKDIYKRRRGSGWHMEVLSPKDPRFQRKYTHVGMFLRGSARREVFPLFSDWLVRHD